VCSVFLWCTILSHSTSRHCAHRQRMRGSGVLHFKWTTVFGDGSHIQSAYVHTDCVTDGGSYFQSSEFAKGSVSVSRLRAATMLRPAALEKKMSRIAARCVRGVLSLLQGDGSAV
jgi:hypothetical protein